MAAQHASASQAVSSRATSRWFARYALRRRRCVVCTRAVTSSVRIVERRSWKRHVHFAVCQCALCTQSSRHNSARWLQDEAHLRTLCSSEKRSDSLLVHAGWTTSSASSLFTLHILFSPAKRSKGLSSSAQSPAMPWGPPYQFLFPRVAFSFCLVFSFIFRGFLRDTSPAFSKKNLHHGVHWLRTKSRFSSDRIFLTGST